MIATCLSIDPKLILLDEPFAGLSEVEVAKTLTIIRDINQTGRTLLAIEHKIRELVELCDEMLVLHVGKVIADGEPVEVTGSEKVLAAYFGGEANVGS